MAEYKTFHSNAGSVTIEVEASDNGGSRSNNLQDLMRVIQDIAIVSIDELQKIPDDKRPSEFELSFGLKGLSEGGVAVSLDESKANFHIKMKWSSATGSDFYDSDFQP